MSYIEYSLVIQYQKSQYAVFKVHYSDYLRIVIAFINSLINPMVIRPIYVINHTAKLCYFYF